MKANPGLRIGVVGFMIHTNHILTFVKYGRGTTPKVTHDESPSFGLYHGLRFPRGCSDGTLSGCGLDGLLLENPSK